MPRPEPGRDRTGRLATVLMLLAISTHSSAAPELPLPDHTESRIVSENLSLNGVSMRVYDLRSMLEVEQLLDFYADEWAGATRVVRVSPWTILSHPDGDHLVTVQVQPAAGGGSFGYVGISDLLRSDPAIAGPRFPLAPGAELINDIAAEDQGRRSRTVLLRSPASIEQSLAWYEHHYRRQGWQRVAAAADAAPGGQALLMNKGGSELNLVAVRLRGQSFIVIVLAQSE